MVLALDLHDVGEDGVIGIVDNVFQFCGPVVVLALKVCLSVGDSLGRGKNRGSGGNFF